MLTGDAEDNLAPGLRRLWSRLTEALHQRLWSDPPARRRWSRPHRTEAAVHNVAEEAGWVAALHLESVVPFDELAWTIEDAVVHELHEDHHRGQVIAGWIALNQSTGKVLGWFIEHKPDRVPTLFGRIIGAATKLDIDPEVVKKSLRHSVLVDGGDQRRHRDHRRTARRVPARGVPANEIDPRVKPPR